jgi:hypothetical protein
VVGRACRWDGDWDSELAVGVSTYDDSIPSTDSLVIYEEPAPELGDEA